MPPIDATTSIGADGTIADLDDAVRRLHARPPQTAGEKDLFVKGVLLQLISRGVELGYVSYTEQESITARVTGKQPRRDDGLTPLQRRALEASARRAAAGVSAPPFVAADSPRVPGLPPLPKPPANGDAGRLSMQSLLLGGSKQSIRTLTPRDAGCADALGFRTLTPRMPAGAGRPPVVPAGRPPLPPPHLPINTPEHRLLQADLPSLKGSLIDRLDAKRAEILARGDAFDAGPEECVEEAAAVEPARCAGGAPPPEAPPMMEELAPPEAPPERHVASSGPPPDTDDGQRCEEIVSGLEAGACEELAYGVLRKGAGESAGVELGKKRLTLRGCKGAAERSGLGAFVGQRLVSVNGVPVSTIEEVKRATKGQTEVQLVFAPACPPSAPSSPFVPPQRQQATNEPAYPGLKALRALGMRTPLPGDVEALITDGNEQGYPGLKALRALGMRTQLVDDLGNLEELMNQANEPGHPGLKALRALGMRTPLLEDLMVQQGDEREYPGLKALRSLGMRTPLLEGLREVEKLIAQANEPGYPGLKALRALGLRTPLLEDVDAGESEEAHPGLRALRALGMKAVFPGITTVTDDALSRTRSLQKLCTGSGAGLALLAGCAEHAVSPSRGRLDWRAAATSPSGRTPSGGMYTHDPYRSASPLGLNPAAAVFQPSPPRPAPRGATPASAEGMNAAAAEWTPQQAARHADPEEAARSKAGLRPAARAWTPGGSYTPEPRPSSPVHITQYIVAPSPEPLSGKDLQSYVATIDDPAVMMATLQSPAPTPPPGRGSAVSPAYYL